MRGTRAISILALTVAGISLAINLYLLTRLREAERMLAPARTLVERLADEEGMLRTEIRLPAGIPINLDIPIDERVSVQIDTVFPLNTRITVPLRSPLGNYDVPVPIRANVPIRATIPLRLRHTFELRSRTSEDMRVPVEVELPG